MLQLAAKLGTSGFHRRQISIERSFDFLSVCDITAGFATVSNVLTRGMSGVERVDYVS